MGEINRKIKILYTIPNFDTAGSGKVLYDLAKGLDHRRFEIIIACKHDKGEFFNDVKALGYPIYLIDSTVPLRPYYSLFLRVRPFTLFLKKHSIAIVHSWHWSSDWSEVLATRMAGATFVYTKKAMSWGSIHWKVRSFLSHYIITINDEMHRYFPYKKQQLIPLGLDTNYYNPNHFTKTNRAVFKIITVANLVPVKGIEVLINAIKLLNNSNIHLDVLGDDNQSYAKELKDLVMDLKLEHQISFLGKQQDVRPYFVNSDLYVIPTLDEGRKEGMPMALVEAMSMAIPVLGSNISGVNFVLKAFPELLFEASDDLSLSHKISKLYNSPVAQRQELGLKLRKYCIKHFSLSAFITAHESLYLKLAKQD